jgi:hypothetical protein
VPRYRKRHHTQTHPLTTHTQLGTRRHTETEWTLPGLNYPPNDEAPLGPVGEGDRDSRGHPRCTPPAPCAPPPRSSTLRRVQVVTSPPSPQTCMSCPRFIASVTHALPSAADVQTMTPLVEGELPVPPRPLPRMHPPPRSPPPELEGGRGYRALPDCHTLHVATTPPSKAAGHNIRPLRYQCGHLTPSNDHHQLDATSLHRQLCHMPPAATGEGPDQSTTGTVQP